MRHNKLIDDEISSVFIPLKANIIRFVIPVKPTWTIWYYTPPTFAAMRCVSRVIVYIEPFKCVWPLKTAVELCTEYPARSKIESKGSMRRKHLDTNVVIR